MSLERAREVMKEEGVDCDLKKMMNE